MPTGLSNGLGPWIIAAFGLALFIAVIATIRSIRESRFSPYYLLRRQASERMRARFMLSFALLVVEAGLLLWLSQRPPLEVHLPALPLPFLSQPSPAPSRTALALGPTVTRMLRPGPTLTPTLVAPPTRAAGYTPGWPSATATRAFPQGLLTPVRPQSTALPGAAIGPLIVAASVYTDSAYPRIITDTFRTGRFTIYAVFTYTHMTPGVAWTHVWLRGDTLVRGESALWSLASSGRAFVFVNPSEGWLPGDYEIDLYLENRLQQVARFRMLP